MLSFSDDWINVGLFTCDGSEQMSAVGGARTTVLHTYLCGRSSSTE